MSSKQIVLAGTMIYQQKRCFISIKHKPSLYYLCKKKMEHDVKIVKIVNVFKKNQTIAILMRKDMPNPGKLVW